MNYWPYLVTLVVLFGLVAFSVRNRRRQLAQDLARASRIGVGTEVMTTSGLYGTVVGRNADGTVTLSIAPGVEVKWALAALRDASALGDTYRRGIGAADAEDAGDADLADDDLPDGKTYDASGDEVQLHKRGDRGRPQGPGDPDAPGS